MCFQLHIHTEPPRTLWGVGFSLKAPVVWDPAVGHSFSLLSSTDFSDATVPPRGSPPQVDMQVIWGAVTIGEAVSVWQVFSAGGCPVGSLIEIPAAVPRVCSWEGHGGVGFAGTALWVHCGSDAPWSGWGAGGVASHRSWTAGFVPFHESAGSTASPVPPSAPLWRQAWKWMWPPAVGCHTEG